MRLSILVVSRTPSLLNQMLSSLREATKITPEEIEILCSWNGSQEEENQIENKSGYELLIANRAPYHFASNVNSLANKANGEFLLLINDDIILDPGSIDAGIICLENEPHAGLAGGRLRNPDGDLIHAGIVFDTRFSPYHQLDQLIPADDESVMGKNQIVPAVTGALIIIRRKDFLSLGLNENYKVCGEDVELCLDAKRKLALKVFYCPDMSGIHEYESTRSQSSNQKANTEDLSRIRMIYREFIEKASKEQLQEELFASIRESQAFRRIHSSQLREELVTWQEKYHYLQINRLINEQKISRLQKELSNLRSNSKH